MKIVVIRGTGLMGWNAGKPEALESYYGHRESRLQRQSEVTSTGAL